MPADLPILPNPSPPKILLAEDYPVNQMIAIELIKQAGFDVDVVGTGLEAVHAATTARYDLVLMDVQMPLLDGLEATRQIRKAEKDSSSPHTPIVAMTAYIMHEDQNMCFLSGMDDYIQKPISVNRLNEIFGKWIPSLPPPETSHPTA